MDGENELIDRLRAFGSEPLDPALSANTLATVGVARRAATRRRTRAKVGLAAMVGFFVGGLGLASAGALPADVQDAAQSVLDHVGVHVPPGHERYNDPAVCPGGPYRNHGDYVRQHPDDPNAGASPCGKPVHAVEASKHSGGSDESNESESGSPDDKGKSDKGTNNDHDEHSSDTSSSSGSPESSTTESSTESTESSSSSSSPESSSEPSERSSTSDESTASST